MFIIIAKIINYLWMTAACQQLRLTRA